MKRLAAALDTPALWAHGYDPTLWPVRWRDPTIGRFTSFDSFEGDTSDPITFHKYLYANADPVNHTDPTGQFSLLGLSLTAGISGTLAGLTTAIYGKAKGWTNAQIARAATYSFFVGAFAGAAGYGLAWGFAAGAAIASGLTGAEAGAYSTLGWTASGLITSPTTLGLAIGNFVDTETNPNADATDRAFAKFNLAISAFVFVGVHAEAISAFNGAPSVWQAGPELRTKIEQIKALPPNQQLTADELAALRKNVDLLKDVVSRNNNTHQIANRVTSIINTDPRFANLSAAQRKAFVSEVQQMVQPK
jgi:hypothetical protein